MILKNNGGYCENTRHKIQTIDSNKQILRSNEREKEREYTRRVKVILKIL